MDINKKYIVEDSSTYYDSHGNLHNIEDDIKQAEKDVERLKANVNFRWTASEVRRAKRIAQAKGMCYQSYLKATLKQAMDRDEKQIM